LITSTFLILMMLAGTWSGIWWIAPRDVARPAPRLILSLALSLWAITLCWGGLAAAVAARSRRRIAAGSLTGLAALAMYLLDYLARFWKPAESFSWLSPFHYYSGLELIVGRSLPLENILILLGTSAAGFGVAYALFTRRDL
jgi:ABC-type transport system involved in multi-copper enzyme maturation permease subunit